MEDKLLRIEELAVLAEVSVQTINNWYRWKKIHPEEELAQLLPDYIQIGTRKSRYWAPADASRVIKFKSKLPRGRGGILGDVTQRHRHNKENKQ